jgi:hypothetical protein
LELINQYHAMNIFFLTANINSLITSGVNIKKSMEDLFRKYNGKSTSGSSRHRWRDNKMDLREKVVGLCWIQLSQDRLQWWGCVVMVMIFRFLINKVFLKQMKKSISFSGSTPEQQVRAKVKPSLCPDTIP